MEILSWTKITWVKRWDLTTSHLTQDASHVLPRRKRQAGLHTEGTPKRRWNELAISVDDRKYRDVSGSSHLHVVPTKPSTDGDPFNDEHVIRLISFVRDFIMSRKSHNAYVEEIIINFFKFYLADFYCITNALFIDVLHEFNSTNPLVLSLLHPFLLTSLSHPLICVFDGSVIKYASKNNKNYPIAPISWMKTEQFTLEMHEFIADKHRETCVMTLFHKIANRNQTPREKSPNPPTQLDFHLMTNLVGRGWHWRSALEFICLILLFLSPFEVFFSLRHLGNELVTVILWENEGWLAEGKLKDTEGYSASCRWGWKRWMKMVDRIKTIYLNNRWCATSRWMIYDQVSGSRFHFSGDKSIKSFILQWILFCIF